MSEMFRNFGGSTEVLGYDADGNVLTRKKTHMTTASTGCRPRPIPELL
jgi:hypothetical protein